MQMTQNPIQAGPEVSVHHNAIGIVLGRLFPVFETHHLVVWRTCSVRCKTRLSFFDGQDTLHELQLGSIGANDDSFQAVDWGSVAYALSQYSREGISDVRLSQDTGNADQDGLIGIALASAEGHVIFVRLRPETLSLLMGLVGLEWAGEARAETLREDTDGALGRLDRSLLSGRELFFLPLSGFIGRNEDYMMRLFREGSLNSAHLASLLLYYPEMRIGDALPDRLRHRVYEMRNAIAPDLRTGPLKERWKRQLLWHIGMALTKEMVMDDRGRLVTDPLVLDIRRMRLEYRLTRYSLPALVEALVEAGQAHYFLYEQTRRCLLVVAVVKGVEIASPLFGQYSLNFEDEFRFRMDRTREELKAMPVGERRVVYYDAVETLHSGCLETLLGKGGQGKVVPDGAPYAEYVGSLRGEDMLDLFYLVGYEKMAAAFDALAELSGSPLDRETAATLAAEKSALLPQTQREVVEDILGGRMNRMRARDAGYLRRQAAAVMPFLKLVRKEV